MLQPALLVALALPVANSPQESSELTCTLVASADPALEDRWNYAPSDQFQVQATGKVHRGETVFLRVFAGGYGLDGAGSARLTYALRVTKPDGKPYHGSDGHVAWDRAADPAGMILAEEAIGLVFEPEDKFGTYGVHVTLTDGVTEKSAEATTEIELVKYQEGVGFADAEALQAWIGTYSASPEPTRVAPALWSHCARDGFLASASEQQNDGFFLELLTTNAWLFPELFQGFHKRNVNEKRGVLWLLAHSPTEPEPFVKKLTKGDKALWDEVSRGVRDAMVEPLRERHDVNELYGRWLATRRLAPLERLVLALDAAGGVISEETVKDKASGLDVPLARVIPGVVVKLLGRILAEDPLAQSYAATLQARGKLPAGVADELAKLL